MFKSIFTFSFVIAFLFFLNAQAASASEVKLTVTDDSYISQGNPDSIYGNKVTLTSATLQPQSHDIMLLKFSTSRLPKGSSISSAKLLLTSYSCSGDDASPQYGLGYLDRDWNEETVRWNGRPQISLDLDVIDASPTVKSFDVTKAVAKWLENPTTNYGVAIVVQGGPYGCNFYSKEKTTDAINLVVRYQAPDTTKPTISQTKTNNVTTNGAVITWATNEDASSYVDFYTITPNTGLPSILNAGRNDSTKTHSVTLTNLAAGKKYYFRVRSADATKNEAISSYTTFTTKPLLLATTMRVSLPPLVLQTASTPGPTTTPSPQSSPTAETDDLRPMDYIGDTVIQDTPIPSGSPGMSALEATTSGVSNDSSVPSSPNRMTSVVAALLAVIGLLIALMMVIILKKKPISVPTIETQEPKSTKSESIKEKVADRE